jgi:hypothetical protein
MRRRGNDDKHIYRVHHCTGFISTSDICRHRLRSRRFYGVRVQAVLAGCEERKMNEEHRRFGLVIFPACIFGAFTLYFLSTGPVMRFYHTMVPPNAILEIYAPLNWVYEKTPAIRRPMDWYLKLWQPEPTKKSN